MLNKHSPVPVDEYLGLADGGEGSMPTREYALLKLQELAAGNDVVWGHVPSYVESGSITRNEALTYLKQLLGKQIPVYRSAITMGLSPPYLFGISPATSYWASRLAEAEQAVQAIDQGKSVKYRGISL